MPQQTRSVARRDPSKLSYEWYINSAAWERRKVAYYSRHPKKCMACGTTEEIHLHHHTYKRLGAEADADLIPLCREHHEAVHQQHRSPGNTMSLTKVTMLVIGKGSRRRNKPRRSASRTRPGVPAKRPQSILKMEDPSVLVGQRVIITAESRVLTGAKGRQGVVREVVSPTTWKVELDGMPGSGMTVTIGMIKRVGSR